MPYFNQRGIATLALLLLLLIGLGSGVFLVQQRTSFLPQAKVDPTTSSQIKRDPLLGIRVSDPKNVDAAVKLGVGKIRVSVESADAFYNQTTEQKAFLAPMLQIFQTAKTNNIQLVLVIKPGSPVGTVDLDNRIGKLYEQLGNYNNVAFELGNEPNAKTPDGQSFWNGDYDSFAVFIKDATTSVRKRWPSAPIIIGALDLQGKINGTNEAAARADLNVFLDALSKHVTLANFDYAIHSYHEATWFNRVYAIQREELDIRNLNSKLWLTETGVTSSDNADQLVETIKIAESKNDIRGVIIHALDSTDNFKLWNGSSPTEAYTKVQTYVNENPKSITVTVGTKNGSTGSTSGTPTVNAADKSCGNNPITPPSENQVWHAFCNQEDYASGHFSCSSSKDCPQNTVQTTSGITAETSSQCVLFKEGSRCIQLRLLKSSTGQNLYNPQDPAFETPNDAYLNNPDNVPFGQVGIGPSEGTGKGPRSDFSAFLSSYEKVIARIKEDERVKEILGEETRKQQEALLATAEQATKDAKEANDAWLLDKGNAELAKKASDATKKAADAVTAAEALRKLAKLEQILKGETKELCVKADLGIRPWLNARRLKARGEDTREDGSAGEKVNRFSRLYVCSGSDSKTKWRVATEGNDNTQDTENENSMERILRLHADSETSENYPTPKYPFTEIEGNVAVLLGQNEDQIRASLEKYINAAKAGKATIE